MTVFNDPLSRPSAMGDSGHRRRRPGHGRRGRWLAVAVGAGLVAITTIIPLVAIVRIAVDPTTADRYMELTTSASGLVTLRNTFVLGVVVGAIGTVIGFVFAYVQTRTAVPGKRILHLVALLPIVSPPAALATAYIAAYGERGAVTHRLLGLGYDTSGFGGLVLIQSLSLFPVAYLSLLTRLRRLDPAMEQAALVMGATRWQGFRKVVLPALAPGLAAPFLLVAVEAIADLPNPLLLGGTYDVLATRAFEAVTNNYDIHAAAVYGLIMLVPALCLGLALRHDARRDSTQLGVADHGSLSVHLARGWPKWIMYAFVVAIAALLISLYVTIAMGSLTQILGVDHSLTLDHFREAFGPDSPAIATSAILSAIAAPTAVAAGFVLAWLLLRHPSSTTKRLYLAASLGGTVPGTILGVGYAAAYATGADLGPIHLPVLAGSTAIFGGASAIVLAYMARSTPAAMATAADALTQLRPHLYEVSTYSSARRLRTLRRGVLPLIRPTTGTALSTCYARCMTSTSTILFLTTPSTKTITTQIIDATRTNRYGLSFAYCVVLTVMILMGVAILRLFLGRDELTTPSQ